MNQSEKDDDDEEVIPERLSSKDAWLFPIVSHTDPGLIHEYR